MEAGSLNRRIVIQKKSVTYDSYNQPIEAWEDKYMVSAKVINSGGGEFYAAQKVYAETQVLFKIRYTKNTKTINEMDRIKYDGRIFEIIAPPNDVNGMRTELQISAKEVV